MASSAEAISPVCRIDRITIVSEKQKRGHRPRFVHIKDFSELLCDSNHSAKDLGVL